MKLPPLETRDDWNILFSSWFYSGYAPFASGTFGTAAALPLVYILSRFGVTTYALVTVFLIPIACLLSDRAEKIHGMKDSGRITIDEVCGTLITCLGYQFYPMWKVLLVGFIVFRVFDVIKLPPAYQFDSNVSGGAGVVLDDVASGVYACITLHLILAYVWM